jgi:hypothetical protein
VLVSWLAAGCSGTGGSAVPDAAQRPALPAFPGNSAAGMERQPRAVSVTLAGDAYTAQAGGNNHSPGPGTFSVVPGSDEDLAWAEYSIGGLTDGKPVTLNISARASVVPGSDEDLPLKYWLGIANYTTYRWEWQGPYTENAAFALNTAELRDRYVSAGGSFSYCVLTVADAPATPDNPDGLNGVTVQSSTTATPGNYLANKPHYTLGEAPVLGDSKNLSAARAASALVSSQYVTLRWEHVTAFNLADQQNEAFQYQVFRKGPLDAFPVNIGSVLAPEIAYVDPLDNASSAPHPIPGATYNYYLRAVNPTGFTPLAALGQIAIPLLPPTSLAASDGVFDDRIRLSWTKAEGASAYDVYRDGAVQPVAQLGNVSTWEDEDVADTSQHVYTVRSRNPFALSADSAPEAGSQRATIQSYDLMTGDALLGPGILMVDAAFNPVTQMPLASYTSDSSYLLSDGKTHLFEFSEGSGWDETSLAQHSGLLSPPGQPCALAFDPDGNLGLIYGEVLNYTFRFALRPAGGGPLDDQVVSATGAGGPVRCVWDPVGQRYGLGHAEFGADNYLGFEVGSAGNFAQLPGTPLFTSGSCNYDICFDSAGDPHMAYCDGPGTPLNLWYLIAGSWQTITVDLDSPQCYGVNIAAAPDGDVCILYQRSSELRFARGRIDRQTGMPEFTHERVVQGAFLGYLQPYTTDLAVDSAGQPHIVYPTDRLGSGVRLWYRYRDAQGWQEPDLVDLVDDGSTYIEARACALALDANGRPFIAFARTPQQFSCVWYR